LAPLPETAPPESNRNRLLLAILAALIGALAGFFGVRLIADAASSAAAGAVVAPPSANVVDTAEHADIEVALPR